MMAWANTLLVRMERKAKYNSIKKIECPGHGFWLKGEVATLTSDFLIGFIGLMFVSLTKTGNIREKTKFERQNKLNLEQVEW